MEIPFLKGHLPRQVVKFIVSGGIVAGTQLTLMFLLTQFLGLWYMFSLVVAFIVAFCVSFTMQKFWTFGDSETSGMHIQASSYFLVALLNLGINALLLYILVQYVALWYLFAQVLIDGLLAISSFLIYKFVIFNRREIKAEEGAML